MDISEKSPSQKDRRPRPTGTDYWGPIDSWCLYSPDQQSSLSPTVDYWGPPLDRRLRYSLHLLPPPLAHNLGRPGCPSCLTPYCTGIAQPPFATSRSEHHASSLLPRSSAGLRSRQRRRPCPSLSGRQSKPRTCYEPAGQGGWAAPIVLGLVH